MNEEQIRPELREIIDARLAIQDEARPDAVAKQHGKGKWTARERLEYLFDDEYRLEYGVLVKPDEDDLAPGVSTGSLAKGVDAPADGVVTLTGMIDGRPAAGMAMDFMTLGGSQSAAGGAKMMRLADLALRRGFPLVSLLDGAGHRIHSMDAKKFAAGGGLGPFREMAVASGWIPQVAAVMGPSFAGPALIAGVADFVPMVKETSQVGMAGPKLVKAGTGEDLSHEDIGGWTVHCRNGVADLAVDDDKACLDAVKRFLSYLPSNAQEQAPITRTGDAPDRRCVELRDLVPESRKRAYDVRKAITSLVDEGSFFELKADFAKNVVAGFGRLDGSPVGFIANQPMVLAGTMDSNACRKMVYLVSLCDAYGLPIISLIDTPGLLVGTSAERDSLVRYAGKLLVTFGQITVPFISIVLRKGYGGGYVLMGGGRSYDSELSLIWPTAEVCAMGVEGSVDIAFHRDFESAPDPEARRQELIDSFYNMVTATRSASGFGIDELIDPAETRRALVAVLHVNGGRRIKQAPPKFRSIEFI